MVKNNSIKFNGLSTFLKDPLSAKRPSLFLPSILYTTHNLLILLGFIPLLFLTFLSVYHLITK